MRTTLAQATGAAGALTEALRARGSTVAVVLARRNGTAALDVYRADGALAETLTVGTLGECWRHCHAMRQALWLLEPPYAENGAQGAA